jgi:hypothetical protein
MIKQIQEMIQANPEATEFAVSPELYEECVKECMRVDQCPVAPDPPVKRCIRRDGFFMSYSETEYDHHAPQYLRELEEYDKQYKAWVIRQTSAREIQYWSARGPIKIHLRYS